MSELASRPEAKLIFMQQRYRGLVLVGFGYGF
jgi:hypothetical protein